MAGHYANFANVSHSDYEFTDHVREVRVVAGHVLRLEVDVGDVALGGPAVAVGHRAA